jgi:drug/metabolite transporter (DMT)-like permease
LTCSVLIRSIHLPSPVITQAGLLIGTLVIGLYVWFRRRDDLKKAWHCHKLRLGLLAMAFVGCSLTFQWATKTTTIANATLTHALQPMLTCLVFAPLFLKEKLDRRALGAAVIGLTGLVILLWRELHWSGPSFGICMGLASAVFFAWSNVQLTRFNGTLARETVLFICLALGSILMLPISLQQSLPASIEAGTIPKLLVFGFVNYALGYVLFYKALNLVPVSRVAIYTYLEPVVAIGAAALFLGEPLSQHALWGGALILASGALVMFGPTGQKCAKRRR